MNIIAATIDTRHQNGVIGTITQFDSATLELQVATDGIIDEVWENPQFELIAMKRDTNEVREVDQDRFTILSKEDHKVQIELKEQFLACRGTVKMQLVIKEGSRLSTTLFYLVIAQSLDHDIVESHRDVKVLDDLEAYVKQGFDDLAYQEQRMVAVEQSTNDLNETMNANEAERNVAETKRSQIFETNETNRTQMFNTQVEKQRIAFSNAQTQREKDFSESQQNMSQEFETSQKERESDFNELQKSNQKTFETNEQKRQTAFNQSQTANQQDFVDNEAERQRLFESNESSRQKSESQRVQNESERVLAETQRADAEVIRQQKIIEFEEKATQLSEDLDSQVARVDEFVTANEEKLLGAHDKTDYMGNAHKSVKDVNDANVEYILGEVNTVHYEGQHITATDTIEKQVRSAILKGQTLVNVLNGKVNINNNVHYNDYLIDIPFKPNTVYTAIFNVSTDATSLYCGLTESSSAWNGSNKTFENGLNKISLTPTSDATYSLRIRHFNDESQFFDVSNVMLIEGDYTNNDYDIPYFEGMQSVRMPVLTTIGKNLFPGFISVGGLNWSTGELLASTDRVCSDFFKVDSASSYVITWTEQLNNGIFEYDENKQFITKTQNKPSGSIITLNVNTKYIKLQRGDCIDINEQVMFEKGNVATPYEPYKSNILTVSDDVELRGIGDVQDTLDLMTGELTERIGKWVLNGNDTSNKIKFITAQEETVRFEYLDINIKQNATESNPVGISNLLLYKQNYNIDEVGFYVAHSNRFVIRIKKEKLNSYDLNGINEYFRNNNLIIYAPLTTESIKTVDLSDQKVYSYDGTTHYSCSAAEGALVPTLSIDVPTNLPALVSRQRVTIESQKEQIITLEEENEQLIAQNEVQDIDISLNQDAINFMLFAPATMSVNDESKNSKGANTMAAYLANQILKGKLDYALVVGRYGSYKEDIDTILIAEGKQDLIK